MDILKMQADKDYEGWEEKEAGVEVGVLIGIIKEEWIRNRREELKAEMLKAEKEGDKEKVMSLLEILQKLIN